MWAHAGKSVAGSAHQKLGTSCQDALLSRTTQTSPSRLLLALSDGAGFARHASDASTSSTAKALDLMEAYTGRLDQVSETDVRSWIESLRHALFEHARERNVEPSDFSCTILGALIEDSSVYVWQLGDGAWIIRTNDDIEVGTWPLSGDYINQTVFITSDDAMDRWTHAYFKSARAIMGITDGLEHICLDYPARHVNMVLCSKIFHALAGHPTAADVDTSIQEFLTSQMLDERTDDDKTLVLAWRVLDAPDANG